MDEIGCGFRSKLGVRLLGPCPVPEPDLGYIRWEVDMWYGPEDSTRPDETVEDVLGRGGSSLRCYPRRT